MIGLLSTSPIALVLSILAGDITGHAVITKRLSKKVIEPANYSLRGAQIPAADPDTASEFDRMVVMLEGVKSSPRPPKPPRSNSGTAVLSRIS